MKLFTMMALLACLCLLGLVQPASAQTIPSTRGLVAFSAQTRFMSLPGYVRWQYFMENGNWISMNEAKKLVNK